MLNIVFIFARLKVTMYSKNYIEVDFRVIKLNNERSLTSKL